MCVCVCVCVIEVGGGWPHTSGTVILAQSVGLFFSTLYFQITLSHTHAHTHTHTERLLQLDRVELGWVGVLWLNAFPVMLHRQASGLLSYYWLPLSLHLCLGALFFFFFFLFSFFAAHRTAARDTSVNVVEKGFEPHSGDEVWGPSGTLKPRWKSSERGL